jgi:iron transport multicopper oxidase
LNVHNPTGAEPVPQSGFLFNNVNDTLSFVPGKTYRLRLINMSGFAMFYFSIDGHDLEVIEIDGIDVQRTTVQSVYITAAQRVSVLVTAKNTTDTNYYIHADMNTDMYDTVPDNLLVNLTVPLYYNNSSTNFAASNDVGMGSTFDDFPLVPIAVEQAVAYDLLLVVLTVVCLTVFLISLPKFLASTPYLLKETTLSVLKSMVLKPKL